MERQVRAAIDEADHILFLVDAKSGSVAGDQQIAQQLRRTGKAITLAVNKCENLDPEIVKAEFHMLGLGEPQPVSAAHGRGITGLIGDVLARLPESDNVGDGGQERGTLIAVVGRPNVGKSTLVNRLLGQERVVTFDQPGTTRDSIFVPFQHDGKAYTLIDTAGVRRRARVDEVIEKISVIKTLQSIEQCNVVLLVLDAQQGISEQDATLAGHILESGRALVVVVNKWDGLESHQRERVKAELSRKLSFLDFAEHRFISARHGSGVGNLYTVIDSAYANAQRKLPTPELTRVLEQAVQEHQPPKVHGRRIKLRYAHAGGQNPPLIVIHGNQTGKVPNSYQRYLEKVFRRELKLVGTPVRIEFRTGENPFADKRNKLTGRQVQRKRRMMAHVKKNKKSRKK